MPLTGIGIVGVGVVWGVHDLTAGTLHWILPTASYSDRTWGLASAQYSACAAAIGSVVFAREILLPPPIKLLPELRWESASTIEWAKLAWRSVERTVRYFPYRYRLITMVICGLASGSASVVTEYSMLSRAAKAAALHERKQREDYAAVAVAAATRPQPSDESATETPPADKSISRRLGGWAWSAAKTAGRGIGSGATAIVTRIRPTGDGARAGPEASKAVSGESGATEATHVFGSLDSPPDDGMKPWDAKGASVGTIRTALDVQEPRR